MSGVSLTFPWPFRIPHGHWPLLDEFKGLAIIGVVIYHVTGVMGWDNWARMEAGVDVFMLVSGLLFGRKAVSATLGQTLWIRARRILPAYWVALLVFTLLAATHERYLPLATSAAIHAVALQAFVPPAYFLDINPSFWFVSFYLGICLLYSVLRPVLLDVGRLLLAAVGLLIAVSLLYRFLGHGVGWYHVPARILSFFTGVIIGRALLAGKLEVPLSPAFAIGLCLLAVAAVRTPFLVSPSLLAVTWCVSYLCLKHCFGASSVGKAVTALLASIGGLSYEIFLLHQPLIGDVNRDLWNRVLGVTSPAPWQLGVGIVLMLIVTVLAAYGLQRATQPKQPTALSSTSP